MYIYIHVHMYVRFYLLFVALSWLFQVQEIMYEDEWGLLPAQQVIYISFTMLQTNIDPENHTKRKLPSNRIFGRIYFRLVGGTYRGWMEHDTADSQG